jgi:hypothetical protein
MLETIRLELREMQSLLASKPVERSDGVVFSSATQAAKAVNIHISCISKACQGNPVGLRTPDKVPALTGAMLAQTTGHTLLSNLMPFW